MTKRQPKGTPKGGQFAEGRKPDGGELNHGILVGYRAMKESFENSVSKIIDDQLQLTSEESDQLMDAASKWFEGQKLHGASELVMREMAETFIDDDATARQIIGAETEVSKTPTEDNEHDIERPPKEPVNPGFGKPYAGVSYDVEGRRVSMWRKGQKVRFYDDDGEQVGPEQSNVAPAVAYAHSQGWRERDRSEKETLLSYIPASEAEIGSLVLVNNIPCEVVKELEYQAVKDLFGRSMNTLTLRRLDTGEEGIMMFGPGGVVSQLPS